MWNWRSRRPEPEPYDWRPALEVILDEARRSIDRQLHSVREARQRAGNLLGYASLIAAALGFSATDRSFGWPGWVAISGFLTVGLAAIYVLYPRVFYQDLSPGDMAAWFKHPKLDGVNHILESAAAAHQANYTANAKRVRALHRGISVAVVGLIVETGALAASLVL